MKQDSEEALREGKIIDEFNFERIEIPTACAEKAPLYGSILPIVVTNADFVDAASLRQQRGSPSPKRTKLSDDATGAGDTSARVQFQLPHEGSWVKFRNLSTLTCESQMQCLFTEYSSFTMQPENQYIMR